tara:strand:- start:2356 stop:2655 length:300 start_codon:yes stop_codon:yes gene_type:complete
MNADSKELIKRIETKIVGCLFLLTDPIKGSPISLSYDEKDKNIIFEVIGESISISNKISVDVFMNLEPKDITELGNSMSSEFVKDQEKQNKPILKLIGG